MQNQVKTRKTRLSKIILTTPMNHHQKVPFFKIVLTIIMLSLCYYFGRRGPWTE